MSETPVCPVCRDTGWAWVTYGIFRHREYCRKCLKAGRLSEAVKAEIRELWHQGVMGVDDNS